MRFGDIIRAERIARNWTLRDLCDKLEAICPIKVTHTPPFISEVETSIRMPPVSLVIKLADVLGFPREYLWEKAKEEMIDKYRKRLDYTWSKKIGMVLWILFATVSLVASEKKKDEKISELNCREITQRDAAIVMAATRQRVKLSWCAIL